MALFFGISAPEKYISSKKSLPLIASKLVLSIMKLNGDLGIKSVLYDNIRAELSTTTFLFPLKIMLLIKIQNVFYIEKSVCFNACIFLDTKKCGTFPKKHAHPAKELSVVMI